jgi:predicted benzoate:H+ symporter BenE
LLSAQERDRILAAAAPAGANSAAGAAALVAALRARGIETLAYANRFEDPGSTSWIITAPAQVTILARHTL